MSRGRILRALLVGVGVLGAAVVLIVPVHTQGPGNDQGLHLGLYKGRQVVAGEVLVKLVDQARLAPFGQDLDVDRDEQVGDGSIRRIHSRSHNVETLLAKLSEFDEVEYAEPNYVVYALLTPNDPYFLNNSLWGMPKIGAPSAWDKTRGSAANVVGVVDTGVDYNHPDLASNVWSAPFAFQVVVGGVTVSCGAGTHGFNAIKKTCDPMDDNGHGTHVSGTIGAVGDNSVGVVGVNWAADIMGLKFLNAQGSGTTADAVNAIEFAIQAKQFFGANASANVRVLSNSWGGGGSSQALSDEIQKAAGANMLFAAAAGNNGSNNDLTPFYPASYSAANVIAVAATDINDNLASFSNYGVSSVNLAAPGVSILSTYPGSRYAYMSGTSMATPHVSGAAALLLAACPSLNTAGIRSTLLANTDAAASLSGKTVTGGRLNVGRAVGSCTGSTPTPDFSMAVMPPSQSVKRGGSASYTVTVTASGGFSGGVTLGLSGQATGWTVTFTPASVSAAGTSTLWIQTANNTKQKSYNLTITGTSGGLTRSGSVTLKVTR